MATTPRELMEALDQIAPTRLAADWDNVGLLVEGPAKASIDRVLFCIDLTHPVLNEAIEADVQAIVAYHPPIFGGLKRLTRRAPSQNLILRLIEAGIMVWSPHTGLDAAPEGLGDWLLDSLGETENREAIEPSALHPDDPAVGMGRRGVLRNPESIDALIAKLKPYLGLEHLRAAIAPRHRDGGTISRVAVCPGAGGSLFGGVRKVDLLLTGEMRHHDVLSRVAGGTSVILTDHTNTERGYLPILAKRVQDAVAIETIVSHIDTDPLRVV